MGGTVPLVHSDLALRSKGHRAIAIASYLLPSAKGGLMWPSVNAWSILEWMLWAKLRFAICSSLLSVQCHVPSEPPPWGKSLIFSYWVASVWFLVRVSSILLATSKARTEWEKWLGNPVGMYCVAGWIFLWSQQTMGRAGLSLQGREEAAADCGAPDIPPVLCGLPLLPLKCFQCQDGTSEDAGILLHRFWRADLSKLRRKACTFLSSNYFLIWG